MQLIKDGDWRDHAPVLAAWPYSLMAAVARIDAGRLDFDAISLGVNQGHNREKVIEEVEKEVEELKAKEGETTSAGSLWAKVVAKANPVALRFYRIKPQEGDYAEARKLREKFLQERREKKKGINDANTEDAITDATLELARHTAYCTKCGKKQVKKVKANRTHDLEEARRNRQTTVVHKLAHLIAGKGTGPKKRRYNLTRTSRTRSRWKEEMKNRAPREAWRQ